MPLPKILLAFQPKAVHRYPLARVLLLLFMLILLAVGAVPGYIKGKWSWMAPPPLTTLKQLRNLHKTGLTLPGWQTVQQEMLQSGGHKWLRQDIENKTQTKALLLLLPQNGPMDQPQVEWMDLNGYWRWKSDSYGQLRFTVEPGDLASFPVKSHTPRSMQPPMKQVAEVEARFFRSWTRQQTYAVLQWYAFPKGGHPAPSRWFWRDRWAQLSRQRVPWIAVCIIIQMEPLGKLERSIPLAESLGKTVQAALMRGPFEK